jgi:hypothetical protein
VIFEPVTTEIGLFKLISLKHGPHGTINEKYPFFRYFLYRFHNKKAPVLLGALDLFSTFL